MPALHDILLAFALMVAAALTIAWDGLLGYGLVELIKSAL
jgi:hypothetical protein